MEWTAIIVALIGLVAATITGQGSVSDEQAAILNEQIPGFGTAMQTATTAANGIAPAYTQWAATQSAANALGFNNPFGSPTGLVGNIGSFLGSANIWVIALIAVAVWYFFFRDNNNARSAF